jgi:hypothetical protein
MRALILPSILLFTLIAGTCYAQSRILVGTTVSNSFGNYSFGLSASAELPFGHKNELDIKDTFSPLESHVALGSGNANIASIGGIRWITSGFGLTTSFENSSYQVTKVSKGADYLSFGPIVRKMIWGAPSRVSFGFIHQVNNGIVNGVESSHLEGGHFGFTTRYGCAGNVCLRITEDFTIGRVLTQGNPVCDGTYGSNTCPRSSAVAGGFTGSVSFEFPRHKGSELDAF